MDDTQRMMQMGGFGFDPSKSLSAEKDGLDIVQHEWALPKFEHRAEAGIKSQMYEKYKGLKHIFLLGKERIKTTKDTSGGAEVRIGSSDGGRSGSRHGDQRLGADTPLGSDGPHWRPPLLRLQAYALLSSSRS
ncbi:hypothetical protein Goari_001901 [Gossypium aridum]|uniref:Uncharacterized protein n=1 Tax=Gossypium aridum TaxID=34290 RepID=A0A7J8Y6U7_GOSAI|nr:hypothetical protein [Gossypium aridum]